MSEEDSLRASQTPEKDSNNSIIRKVKSRVSSIFPDSISKWFSPSVKNDSKNGSIRRRRDDSFDDDDGGSFVEGRVRRESETVIGGPPPSKRTKSSLNEFQTNTDELISSPGPSRFSSRNNSLITSTTQKFSSSTPTATLLSNRRKLLGLNKTSSPYDFSSRQTNLSTNFCNEDNEVDNDVELQIPEDRKKLNIPPTNRVTQFSSYSRRSLNVASASAAASPPTTSSILNNLMGQQQLRRRDEITEEDLIDEEDNDDTLPVNESSIEQNLENGGIETASESGDSLGGYTANRQYLNKRPASSACMTSEPIRNYNTSIFGNRNKTIRLSNQGINFNSHLQTEKSLFSDKNMSSSLNNSTTSLNSWTRRQSFNPSLYGSSSALSDSRLLNINSPFYKGRTMYGGASAYSKRESRLQKTYSVPVQIKPSSSLSTLSSSTTSLTPSAPADTTALSNTAKRILDLMNQFTSPLTDVKKMSHLNNNKSQQQELNSSRNGRRLQQPQTPYSRPGPIKQTSPTQSRLSELQIPSISQLLQLKKLQNNTTERVRQIASHSKSVLNKPAVEQEVYKLPEQSNDSNTNNKHVSKVREKRYKSALRSDKTNENEQIANVKLPEISLPMFKTIPKIDIALPVVSTKSMPPSIIGNKPITIQATTTVSTAKLAQISDFEFSSPIKITSSLAKDNIVPINNFKFSEPLNVTCDKEQLEKLSPVPAKVTKTPSVPISNSFGDKFKVSSDTWECDACMIRNKTSVEKCVACSTPKPGSKVQKTVSAPAPLVNNTFGDKFKVSSDTWECDACMVRNKKDVNTCVACSTSKPGSTQIVPITNSFGSQFKAKSDTWECDVCMVRNKTELNSCVACSTAKPGCVVKKSENSIKLTATDNDFKKLVAKQNEKWECSACMTRNDSTKNKCQCCEQAKPGAVIDDKPKFAFGVSPNAPKFQFGVPAGAKEEIKAVTTKSDFIFGNKSAAATTTTEVKSTFSFGVKPIEEKKTEEAPLIITPTPTSTFSFGTKTTGEIKSKDTTDSNKFSDFKFGTLTPVENLKPTTLKDDIKKIETPVLKLDSSDSLFGVKSTHPKPVPTSSFSFGSNVKPNLELTNSPKPSSNFAFGSTTTITSSPAVPKSIEKTPTSTLLFGSAAKIESKPVIGGFSFGQSSPSSATVTKPQPIQNLGKLTEAISSPPFTNLFGDKSANPEEVKKSSPFASPASIKPIFGASANISFGSSSASVVPTTTQQQTSFVFGGNTAATTAAAPTSNLPSKPTGLFAFGTGTTTPTPIKPNEQKSVFGTTVAEKNPTFGSTTKIESTANAFGSSKFGGQSTVSFGIGMPSTTASPSFGGFGNNTQTPNNNNSPSPFAAATSTTAPPSTFGQTSALPGFNSFSTGTPNPAPPTFGNTSFSNNPSPAFNNPSPAFAAFGSSSFEPVITSDEPASKKMNSSFQFGGEQQQQQQNNPVFGFGGNNNNNNNNGGKQAFEFNVAAAPNFDFGGSGGGGNQATTAPYAFGGGAPAAPTAGVFSFGGGGAAATTENQTTNAPFQFGASSAMTNNPFAGNQTSGQQPLRRKAKATRRVTPR